MCDVVAMQKKESTTTPKIDQKERNSSQANAIVARLVCKQNADGMVRQGG